MAFEDPTQLARCIKSDCQQYRAGGSPLCAQHLREQEVSAGATSIVEPEVEAAARAAGDRVMTRGRDAVLMDPDVNGGPAPPSLDTLEPVWDGTQYVLRPKKAEASVNLKLIRSLVRDLVHELDMTWDFHD